MSSLFSSSEPLWLWAVFACIVAAALFVDVVLLRKKGSHVVGAREAATWSVIWVMVSLVFNGLLWWAVAHAVGLWAARSDRRFFDVLRRHLAKPGHMDA